MIYHKIKEKTFLKTRHPFNFIDYSIASTAHAEYLHESTVHGWVKGLAGLEFTMAEHENTSNLQHFCSDRTAMLAKGLQDFC